MMLDLAHMRRARLADLSRGELFLPITPNGNKFLAGRLNEHDLRLALDGEAPFSISATANWSRGPGIAVAGIRFEADPEQAVRVDGTLEMQDGLLLLANGVTGIVGRERSTPFPMWVGEELDGAASDVIGFRSWRIVHGADDNLQVLFEHTVEEAAGR